MRKTGEGGFNKLAQSKKPGGLWKKRDLKIPCHKCGYVGYFSAASLQRVADQRKNKGKVVPDWTCRECKKKDEADVIAAILAVAKRKQEMKERTK